MRRDRHSTVQKRDEQGLLKPLIFQQSDLDICKLLSPYRFTREPWSYQYLIAAYIARLLGRSEANVSDRLQQLKDDPHNYIGLPSQPTHYGRPLIYCIGENGKGELRNAGFHFKRYDLKKVEHELMASLIGASFEYAALTVPGVSITLDSREESDPLPDWPVFKLTTPSLNGERIFMEADTGSQSYTVIEGKIEEYLKKNRKGDLILFFTAEYMRVEGINECIKRVVIRMKLPKASARSFGVIHFPYNRFLGKQPPLTAWAVTGTYLQPAGEFTLK